MLRVEVNLKINLFAGLKTTPHNINCQTTLIRTYSVNGDSVYMVLDKQS